MSQEKQTFIHRFRNSNFTPITRQQIANALRKIADELDNPAHPDPNESKHHLEWNHSFVISGFGHLGDDSGFIKLTTTCESDKEIETREAQNFEKRKAIAFK